MKTAKKFLKAKGLKDTLYNVNYNPNQNRGLRQKEWIRGGLSTLLEEYAGQFRQPDVLKSVCAFTDMCKIKTKKGECRKNCKHYEVKQTVL